MSKDELLQAAIAAAKSGNLPQAAELFMQVVKIDPACEQGWLGLGYSLSAPDRREYCFRRVLAINPDNRVAKAELARLANPAVPPPPPVPARQSPFVESGNAPRPVESSAPPRPPAPVTAPKAEAPALRRESAPAASTPTAAKAVRPKPVAQKKKKSNLPLVAALAAVAAFVLLGSVVGIGYAVFGWGRTSGLAANPPALATQPGSQALVTPLATPSPTPDPPTPIPSPMPTIVYTPVYEVAPCPFDAPNASVNCGYLTVPEDRTGDPSRTIKLAVAVYRTRSENPAEPVVFLQGGPGAEAVNLSANAYHVLVSPFLSKRDFITFDQRGTGLSEPVLECDELTKMYLQDIRGLIDSSTRDLVYANAFHACSGLMKGQGIQLRGYKTLESAADVRDLLAVLNYPQAHLYGASYGTRLAQVIMREYPEIVKTAILDSVVPLDTSLFANYSNSITSGLETLFSDCALDPQCNAAYPDLENTFWNLVKELDENPVTVTSSDYPTGLVTQTVTGETLINLVLGSIKSSRFIDTAPQTISRFKGGDFSTLVMQQSSLLFMFDDFASGLFINMTCHEQVLSTTLEDAQTEANQLIIRDYAWLPFYGDVEDVFKTCKSWGAAAPAYGENSPTISDIPSLIITGSYDPTTPPAYARQIAAHLSNSYYFEFPTLGHTPTAADSSGCAMDIVQQFLDNPEVEPDRACLGELEQPVFVVPYTGNPALALKTVTSYGIKMSVPKDWQEAGEGFYYRGNSPFDITEVGILVLPVSIGNIEEYFSSKVNGYRGLDGPLMPAGERSANGFTWQLYTSSSYGRPVDIAMVEDRGWSIIVMQFCNQDEHDALYRTVFLPIVDSASR
ncbi:MAG TPA: hypothetical protein DCG54_03700 [Anaerolineae bacterium]|nr:hypothetical protein [Anaerolineae bacterium]